MAEHYYLNAGLKFVEVPLTFGGSISVAPGKYVKGDPANSFGEQVKIGTLTDEGTGQPAIILSTEVTPGTETSSPYLLYDEAQWAPAGYGTSGFSGASGFSGTNAVATSGYSGFSGVSGYSGFSGETPSPVVSSLGFAGGAAKSGIITVSGAGAVTLSTSGQVLWISA